MFYIECYMIKGIVLSLTPIVSNGLKVDTIEWWGANKPSIEANYYKVGFRIMFKENSGNGCQHIEPIANY